MSRRWIVSICFVVAFVLALGAVGVGTTVMPTDTADPPREASVVTVRVEPDSATSPTRDDDDRIAKAIVRRRTLDPAERARMLEQIQTALQHPAESQDLSPEPEAEARLTSSSHVPTPGMVDRSGGQLSSLLDVLNAQVLPLTDECYELARFEDPTLHGMMDLELAVIADAGVGGLVETIALGSENEIANVDLVECVQQSLLSTAFEGGEATGRQEARLTLRFGP
jgi:hypothetical protein